MRQIFALALVLVATPAFAQITSDLDSDKQVNQYGSMFAYLGAAVGAIVLLLVVTHFVKSAKAEHTRGKKPSPFREEVIDERPKKPEAKFMGERVPDWKLDNRRKAIKSSLKHLSATDKLFERKRLTSRADAVFQLVKAAIETRSSKKIQTLLTEECLEGVVTEIKSLRKKKRLRIFGQLEVHDVEIIHFEAPASKAKHMFIALITAKSKDYFQDDESGELLRGDKKYYMNQEFWCFRRSKDSWLLERIRPSDDMDRILSGKIVLGDADMKTFSKDADPEVLREFLKV